ncbi:hypothetical protein [Mesorhizobium sp. 1B3]|uniref:hypothetical protein n=1 Tax=Mesorhizobium sp. 1B3 TaxID=3243599 RepID=UPI003D99F73B
MERVTFASLRKRAVTLAVTGLGAILAGVASLSYALYEAANPEQLPVVVAGQPIDTGRWTAVLRGATFHKATADGSTKDKLAVDVELTNRSAMSSGTFSDLFTIEHPPAGLEKPVFHLWRDKAIAVTLEPDMPERVVAIWEWPETAPPPAAIRIDVAGQIYKRRDNLYGAPGWFDRPPIALVELSVSTGKGDGEQ